MTVNCDTVYTELYHLSPAVAKDAIIRICAIMQYCIPMHIPDIPSSKSDIQISTSQIIPTTGGPPHVPTGNMFQDLLRLHETTDNTECYIQRDIRVTYMNTVKFN